jgi:hypothetical protein
MLNVRVNIESLPNPNTWSLDLWRKEDEGRSRHEPLFQHLLPQQEVITFYPKFQILQSAKIDKVYLHGVQKYSFSLIALCTFIKTDYLIRKIILGCDCLSCSKIT